MRMPLPCRLSDALPVALARRLSEVLTGALRPLTVRAASALFFCRLSLLGSERCIGGRFAALVTAAVVRGVGSAVTLRPLPPAGNGGSRLDLERSDG